MKYCSACGGRVSLKIPADDNRERFVCDDCDTIHYQNPLMVVGCIPVYVKDGKPQVLLCKRGIEPRLGFWTLPAGFMENAETAAAGAERETMEESCATVLNLVLYRAINATLSNQVHLFFRADLPLPQFETTPESTEVRLFSFDEIPWSQLAFPTVYRALEDFVAEYNEAGEYTTLMYDVGKPDWVKLDKHPES